MSIPVPSKPLTPACRISLLDSRVDFLVDLGKLSIPKEMKFYILFICVFFGNSLFAEYALLKGHAANGISLRAIEEVITTRSDRPNYFIRERMYLMPDPILEYKKEYSAIYERIPYFVMPNGDTRLAVDELHECNASSGSDVTIQFYCDKYSDLIKIIEDGGYDIFPNSSVVSAGGLCAIIVYCFPSINEKERCFNYFSRTQWRVEGIILTPPFFSGSFPDWGYGAFVSMYMNNPDFDINLVSPFSPYPNIELGWRQTWMGIINDLWYPWLVLPSGKFLYGFPVEGRKFWLWVPSGGWIYVANDTYPYAWSEHRKEWISDWEN